MTPTTVTTQELKVQLEHSLALLRTLRDETRVELHLASLDARDEWERLQPKLRAAETAVEHFTKEAAEQARESVGAAMATLTKFREGLVQRRKTEAPPLR